MVIRNQQLQPSRAVTPQRIVSSHRRGISRMEFVVLSVLGICIFVCLPQFLLAKREAQQKQQKSYQFRKVGLAMSQYLETYRSFPPAKKSSKKPSSH